MPRPSRLVIVLALISVAMIGAGAYAYWHFLLRAPLAGDSSHDFGDVWLEGETALVEHTFRLANRLERPLTIAAIRPDCGCLTTRDVRRTLAPGAAFDVPVTLVAKGGKRTAIAHVVLDDGTSMALRVRANGRYKPRLWSADPVILLGDANEGECTIALDTYETMETPSPPQVTGIGSDVSVEFLGWALRHRPKDIVTTPTHWQGTLRAKGVNRLPSTFVVAWGDCKPVEVTISPTIATDLRKDS